MHQIKTEQLPLQAEVMEETADRVLTEMVVLVHHLVVVVVEYAHLIVETLLEEMALMAG